MRPNLKNWRGEGNGTGGSLDVVVGIKADHKPRQYLESEKNLMGLESMIETWRGWVRL